MTDVLNKFCTGQRNRMPPTEHINDTDIGLVPYGKNSMIPDTATYVSFGDGDTTATVTAFGGLMQVTRYLGAENSGFFCVDGPNTPGPSYIVNAWRDTQS